MNKLIRRIAPSAVLILGLLVMLGAFLYSAANALPYQDPTAEMLAHQAAEGRKWMTIALFGLLATLCGIAWIWLRMRAGKRARNPLGGKAHS
jgi:hypothetical protein